MVPPPGSLPKEIAASEPDEIAAWLETEEGYLIPHCAALTHEAQVAIGLRNKALKPVRLVKRDTKDIFFIANN
jgi:hypothetical protein